MTVDPATSSHRVEYRGESYHFCSAGCQTKFAADPARYLEKSPTRTDVPECAIYTCPMHPQIRQTGARLCRQGIPRPRPLAVAHLDDDAGAVDVFDLQSRNL